MATRKSTVTKKTTAAAPTETATAEGATPGVLVCPRCGSAKFGPEERTRFEGKRTVRYTILVCERGHTFAKPVSR